MTNFVFRFFDFIQDFFGVLTSRQIELFGYHVSIGYLILSFIIISFVASIFWKGAKG